MDEQTPGVNLTPFPAGQNAILLGGKGNDTITGDTGNDQIQGRQGADLLSGGSGNDTIFGGRGNDTILGRDGNDRLLGDRDNDQVDGGNGNDTIIGCSLTSDNFGSGEIDTLIGGAGADTFILGNTTRTFYDNTTNGPGITDYALIQDFNSQEDFLELRRSATYVTGAAPTGLPTGTALFIDNDGIAGLSANDELVAVLAGVATNVVLTSRFVLV